MVFFCCRKYTSLYEKSIKEYKKKSMETTVTPIHEKKWVSTKKTLKGTLKKKVIMVNSGYVTGYPSNYK